MNAASLLYDALRLCLDTLVTLGRILRDPRRADDYCRRCGLPPLDVDTDWLPRAEALRDELEAEDVAQRLAEVLVVVDEVRETIAAVRGERVRAQTIELTRRLVVPVMLYLLYRDRRDQSSLILLTAIVALVLIDERLQESLPGSLSEERWTQLTASLIEEGRLGKDVVATAGVPAAILALWGLAKLTGFDLPAPFIQAGFDHPDMPGLDETLESARHTIVMFFGRKRPFDQGAYDDFNPPQPLWHHREVALAFVPLVRVAEQPDPDPALPPPPSAHGGGLFVQGSGNLQWDFGDTREAGSGWTLVANVAADGGGLFPLGGEPKVEIGGAGGLATELTLTYTRPAIDDASGLPDNAEIAEDPVGVSLRLRRATFAMRLALDLDLRPTFQFDGRLDGVELRIGKLPVLGWILPSGARLAFDAGVHFDSDTRELRLIGSIGGELVIPLDLKLALGFGEDANRVSLLEARARSVRIRFAAGGDYQQQGDAEPGQAGGVRVEITTNLSVKLLDILTVHADGVGFAFTAGATEDGRGNLAGIANVGWDTLWPTGVGIEVKAWKIRGGGHLLYDHAARRLGGAAELQVGSWFQLKGLGLCEPTPDGLGRSWVAVGTLESPKPGGLFSVKGCGVVYASNRRSDPQAFLDGVGTGDLDAIFFPTDPVGNAAAYVGVLGRLFPAADDGEVVGLLVKFGLMASRVTIALGLLIDAGAEPKLYLIGQLRAVFPTEELAALRIQADGVAVWDAARDEFQMRIVLRNSRCWGGELTGEAMMFKGDPDREDGQDQTCTIFSVGGFHPAYSVPGAALRVPPRVTLVVARGDHLRIEVKLYFALTPGAFHLGFEALLQARFAGFGIRGRLGVDALIGKDELNVSIRASVELQLGSRTLAGASFEGALIGYGPTLLCGRACIKALFWEICTPSFCVELTFGDNLPPPMPDVAAQLEAAVRDARSWDAGAAPGLTLRKVQRDGVWLSPSAPLRFTQTIVPLRRAITRFDGGRLGAPATFDVEPGAQPGWQARPLNSEFAPVLYFELTPEQKLAARALESLPAGFELERAYEAGAGVEAGLEYDQILIDKTWPVPPRRGTVVLSDAILAAAGSLAPGAATTFYRSPRRPLTMRAERYAVVDDSLAVVASDLDFSAAHSTAGGIAERMVVPMAEVA